MLGTPLKRWSNAHLASLSLGSGAGSYLGLPNLTSTQRDALTPTAGYALFNITTSTMEVYSGTAWVSLTDQDLSVYQLLSEKDQLNGYAGLDSTGRLKESEFPLINHVVVGYTSLDINPESTLIENLDGTITLPANGAYFLVDNHSGYQHFDIPSVTVTIPPDIPAYLVADYNNGSPRYLVITDSSLIDYATMLPIGEGYRVGSSTYPHTQHFAMISREAVEAEHHRRFLTSRYSVEGNGLQSIMVDSSLNITGSGGYVWVVNTRYNVLPVTSSTRQFVCEYTGSSWNITNHLGPIINNTQYNGPSGFTTLTDTYYTINYLYRGIEIQDHSYLVLGSTEYSSVDLAKASSSIPNPPDLVKSHAMFVGRVITQKGATTGFLIESAFTSIFSASTSITQHSALSGLNADDHTQYYNQTRGDLRYALIAKGVTSGDSHDHTSGHGAQINHTNLSSIGTNTHAQIDTALTRLANTSGTNTGDQTLAGLGGVPTTTTVNGHSLSSNVIVTQSDVGLGNVTNTAQIPLSTGTTKGDLLVYTASSTIVRQPVGTDGQVLTSDSTRPDGIIWNTRWDSAVSSDITPDVASTTGSISYSARRDHTHNVSTYSSAPAVTTPLSLSTAGTSGQAPARGNHTHQSPGGLQSITAPVGIANTETVIENASIPANLLQAGTTLRIQASGVLTSGGTGGSSIWRIRVGTTSLTGNIASTLTVVNSNNVTNAPYFIEAIITVRTSGSGGTVIGGIKTSRDSSTAWSTVESRISNMTATVAVNTTITNLVELTLISGNAGSTFTTHNAVIEVVKM
jgi:hypothetical protein